MVGYCSCWDSSRNDFNNEMSRYCGNKDSTEVIKAADIWKDKCLLNDGSVFSNDAVWTQESLTELHKYFTENPKIRVRTQYLLI